MAMAHFQKICCLQTMPRRCRQCGSRGAVPDPVPIVTCYRMGTHHPFSQLDLMMINVMLSLRNGQTFMDSAG